MGLIRIHKPEVKRWVIPKRKGHFYRCTCGNHLAGYKLQGVCEDCGAWLDWDNVINGMEELEKRRR
jgi:hypothetical protein